MINGRAVPVPVAAHSEKCMSESSSDSVVSVRNSVRNSIRNGLMQLRHRRAQTPQWQKVEPEDLELQGLKS